MEVIDEEFEQFEQNEFKIVFQNRDYSQYLVYHCTRCKHAVRAAVYKKTGHSATSAMSSHVTRAHKKER